MKKLAILFMVIVLIICLAASPVYAKGENAKGAVKVDLVEVGTGPDWNVVGSAILNTTASGKLIVNVNMDTEPNLVDYDVAVLVFYSPPPPTPVPPHVFQYFPDVLDTNAKGQGNAHVQVNIDPPPTNSSIWVVVVVREVPATGPGDLPDYYNMPPPVEVPLK
jgi:hypothetical protein